MTFFYLFNTILLIGLAFLIFLLSRQSKEKGLPLAIFPKIIQPGRHNSRKNLKCHFAFFCLNFTSEYIEPQNIYIIKFSITVWPFGESKKNKVLHFIFFIVSENKGVINHNMTPNNTWKSLKVNTSSRFINKNESFFQVTNNKTCFIFLIYPLIYRSELSFPFHSG